MTPFRMPAFRRAPSSCFILLLALVVGACSGSDGSEGDTENVGSDLLSSRSPMGTVPGATEGRLPAQNGDHSGSSTPVDVSQLGYEWGDPDAPLRILEFSDFGCGYCRQFHTETWPTLAEEYVATGKVRWRYVPMVLGIFGPNSENAALAAECAGEEHFRAVADRLFEEQSEWKRAGDPTPVFRRLAVDAGVDPAGWDACMADGSLRERVDAGTALSRQLGVRGTPTFFVIGYGSIPGAIPLEIFQEVLDSALVQASRDGGGGA